jgi:hypothetical protein
MSDSNYFVEVAAYEEGVQDGQEAELDGFEEFVNEEILKYGGYALGGASDLAAKIREYIKLKRSLLKGG